MSGQDFANELNNLGIISEKDHSYAGFAKSLYYQLTGILSPVSINLPDYPGGAIERSKQSSNSLEEDIAIYPNPFKELLKVEFSGFDEIDIVVLNISGQKILELNNQNEDAVLQTKFWPGGVYFVIVKNGEEVLRREKVIHVK